MPLPKLRRATVIPLILLVYLGVMAYIGRGELLSGNYLYYFGIIATTLLCILLLRIFLVKRERLRDRREADLSRHDRRPHATDTNPDRK